MRDAVMRTWPDPDRRVRGGVQVADRGGPRCDRAEGGHPAHWHRPVAAQEAAVIDEDIPVTVRTTKGVDVISRDEHPRADTSVESLAKLKPTMRLSDPEATVTAGNASGQNDAAAMCIVTTAERADELGLRPLVRLVSRAVPGVPPPSWASAPCHPRRPRWPGWGSTWLIWTSSNSTRRSPRRPSR